MDVQALGYDRFQREHGVQNTGKVLASTYKSTTYSKMQQNKYAVYLFHTHKLINFTTYLSESVIRS